MEEDTQQPENDWAPQSSEQESPVEEPVVAHFDEGPVGLGLDGSTPFEGGIQGRLTHAGSHRETETNERDWQVHVDVDQPVQRIDD